MKEWNRIQITSTNVIQSGVSKIKQKNHKYNLYQRNDLKGTAQAYRTVYYAL